MFKSCTFNINILPDDKHQQDKSPKFDDGDGYVKFDSYGGPEPIDSLLKESFFVKGADYYWRNENIVEPWELWVLPSCFGQVYHAIHSSAGVSSSQDVHIADLPSNYELLGERIYELIHEHKNIRLEYFSGAIHIYKVNQNAN